MGYDLSKARKKPVKKSQICTCNCKEIIRAQIKELNELIGEKINLELNITIVRNYMETLLKKID